MKEAEVAVLMAVEGATWSARVKHPGVFGSDHHAYAVLLEELEEYWAEVKKKNPNPNILLHELIDLAAVCVRAATELAIPRMDADEAMDALDSRCAGVPSGNLKLRVAEGELAGGR